MAAKKPIFLLSKIALSLGALLYVFSRIDPGGLLGRLREIDPRFLLAALVVFNLSKIVSSIRLNRLFKAIGLTLTEREALRLYYIGMFYNLFLPGGIGGDGYKIYLLNRHREIDAKFLMAATLLDRISGLAALLFFAGIFFLSSRLADLFPWLVPLDYLGLVLVFPLTRLLYRGRFQRVFFNTLLLGALTQILQLVSALFLAWSLGVEADLPELLTLFLLSSVAAVLPLSVGGVGIREFVFLYGFGLVGLPAEEGVAFSMLFFLLTALSSFLGIFLRHGLENPRA